MSKKSNKIHFTVNNEAYFINLKKDTVLIVNFNTNQKQYYKLHNWNYGDSWIVLEIIKNNEYCVFDYENIEIIEDWKNGFQTK